MNKEFHFSHPLKVQNVNFLRKNVDVRGFTFDNLEYAAMSSLPLNNVTQVFGCEIKEYERKWASKKVTSQRWHFIDIVHMFRKVKKDSVFRLVPELFDSYHEIKASRSADHKATCMLSVLYTSLEQQRASHKIRREINGKVTR